jgi:hypothetical protein
MELLTNGTFAITEEGDQQQPCCWPEGRRQGSACQHQEGGSVGQLPRQHLQPAEGWQAPRDGVVDFFFFFQRRWIIKGNQLWQLLGGWGSFTLGCVGQDAGCRTEKGSPKLGWFGQLHLEVDGIGHILASVIRFLQSKKQQRA